MNTATIRSDWVGQVVNGRFTLLQWLGGSGRGGVFLTELEGPGSQKAAIKLILADAGDAEAHLAGWALASSLSHPHLMRLFHRGRCQMNTFSLLYSVTEYAEEVLSQILLDRPLTPSEAREMLGPVLDALSYLHGKGVVHGHLKPSNIMVVEDQLKLSSDSLNVAGEPGEQYSEPGVYEAPECAKEGISPAADVWSLGVTLVEALTQHPPAWDRSTQGDPVTPGSIPQPFADIARDCLRVDPARRCTLSDVKARLEPAQSLPVPASKSVKKAPAKLRVTAVVFAVLVLFAVVAILHLRSYKTGPSLDTGTQQSESASAGLPPQSPVAGNPAPRGGRVKGAVAERVMPDILPRGRASIRGQVNVGIRVTVDSAGDVSNATFDSPGTSRYFAKQALEAARQWRFKPAQVNGRAVPSVWTLQFHFTQTATEITAVEVSR
jgi:TonB family protein